MFDDSMLDVDFEVPTLELEPIPVIELDDIPHLDFDLPTLELKA